MEDFKEQYENWDLNHLKCINDKFGHARGDKVIAKLSSILGSYSSDRCHYV